MAFMELQSEFGRWYLVETRNGTEVIPEDVCGRLSAVVTLACTPKDTSPGLWAGLMDAIRPYLEGSTDDVTEVSCRQCWGARYSAPGYLDCTDWVLADTQAEAEEECRSMYGDDEEPEEEIGGEG